MCRTFQVVSEITNVVNNKESHMSPEGIKALADILVEKSKVYALNLKEFGALNPQDQVRRTSCLLDRVNHQVGDYILLTSFEISTMLPTCPANSARFAAAQPELGRPWKNELKVNKIWYGWYPT